MKRNWQIMNTHFDIINWDACCGGVRTASQWLSSNEWRANQLPDKAFSDSLEYLYISPKQRRRLSDISKLTIDVALGCIGEQQQIPTVFSSRYGEVGRMNNLLEKICSGEDASPMDFSLSLHNTSSGLLSIQTGNQSPSTAVSAGHDSLAAGIIESISQLRVGQPQVLLVVFEDRMPKVYQCFASKNEYPIAAAFLLKAGGSYKLSVRAHQIVNMKLTPPLSTFSQLRQLIGMITGNSNTIINGERMSCQIVKP